MKNAIMLLLFNMTIATYLYCQNGLPDNRQRKDLSSLIDKYSQAGENRDTTLLKTILTNDVDQLVSSGEWRNGIDASVKGMINSSTNSPGTRMLNIDKIRMLNPTNAIIDCRYEIQNAGGNARKMWSTFIVVFDKGIWKISAIRNMLPVAP